jgi:hypothetical protein
MADMFRTYLQDLNNIAVGCAKKKKKVSEIRILLDSSQQFFLNAKRIVLFL